MQINLITDIPNYRADKFPASRFVEWTGDVQVSISAREFAGKILHYAGLFSKFKISSGDRVATYSQSTRIDMIAAEFAVMSLAGIVCPLHWTPISEGLRSAVQNIQPQFYIISDNKHRHAIESLAANQAQNNILQLDLLDNDKGGNYSEASLTNKDSALIISTSGTSGNAKGVLLSHQNLIFTVLSISAVVPINAKHTILSFLPVSHILERTVLYSAMLLGAEIHFADSPRHAYVLTTRVKPHYFTGVPRNLERTFVRFQHASNQRGFFTRQIFAWSLQQGKRSPTAIISRIGPALAKRFVLRKLRRLFGRRIKGILVGGAAMNTDIMRWFEMAGIKVREGYGLSETSGVITFNRFTPGEYAFGTTGRPLPGVEVKIDQTSGQGIGQVMVRSPSLMQGYFQNGQFLKLETDDGWFATGDTGSIDEHGFLSITGRIKDNFKNSFGQYVAPIQIEKRLELEIGIDRSIVIGFQKPFTSAIIRPDFEFLASWALAQKVHWTAPEFMVHNPEVIQYYQAKIDGINKKAQMHERILGFALVAEEWNADSGLLTATLKLKRETILKQYQKVVRGIYN